MPGDTLVDERVAADTGAVLGTSASDLKAATIGKSSRRRALGLTGQYAMLVLLAAIVLIPLVFAVLQALSPPFSYLNAGAPLHPVDVQWKHGTWLSGGPFSVVVRTLIVVAALAWVQLKAARREPGDGARSRPPPSAAPRPARPPRSACGPPPRTVRPRARCRASTAHPPGAGVRPRSGS